MQEEKYHFLHQLKLKENLGPPQLEKQSKVLNDHFLILQALMNFLKEKGLKKKKRLKKLMVSMVIYKNQHFHKLKLDFFSYLALLFYLFFVIFFFFKKKLIFNFK